MELLHFKTQKDFAAALNIQQGSLSDILRERVNVSNAIKDKLEMKFDVNLTWLEDGIGEPFFKKKRAVGESKEGVPYFDMSLSDAKDRIVEEQRAEYLVNYLPFNDCTAYLPVYGDSMYPQYAAGEIIAIKEITNYEILQWGEAYVVMTDEDSNSLRTIKLIFQHTDDTKLILRSSNPNFKGDTVVSKKNILALYIIKGKITRNII
ncbi:XRE family transcriptional regulator [Pedobacter sp. D749]|uniref:LexA family transcriptional regulator n=1 Tax=Pedobacter sp. D749 TaxID=2856523 RepID=UPI001C5A00F8|nr:XRE family transcriptional regulator [Pedobacter sp. D749]QXU42172.1 DNA-binding protein [Pedobacter sp. D749]